MAELAGATMSLKSSDGEIFQVDKPVAHIILKTFFEDLDIAQPVPLPNVSSPILTKVIDYCNFHVNADKAKSDVEAWDDEFLKVDKRTLFDIILAGNYLHIKGLLDLSTAKVASLVRGRSPSEIREYFNIKNEFSPEEEEEVRRENKWAFE